MASELHDECPKASDILSRRSLLAGLSVSVLAPDLLFRTAMPVTREQQILESIAKGAFPKLETPGLWCAIFIRDQLVAQLALGRKRASVEEPASVTDRVVWGSISQCVGGPAIGAIVQQGKLRYDARLRDVFPELSAEFSSTLLNATVAQFIVHHSGLGEVPWQKTDPKSARAWRTAFLRQALTTPTVAGPGDRYAYAPGIDIAAAMAERLYNSDFAAIQRALLFGSANLESVRYGWPGEGGVYGHVPSPDGGWKETLIADFSANYAAAGGVTGSIVDLARFGAIHANARVRGLSTISRATFAKLHSHVEPIDASNAPSRGATTLSGLGGWPDGNLMHDGMWYRGDYAFLQCSPRRRVSVALYRNSHRSPGKADFGTIVDELCEAIPILHYAYSGPV